MRRLVGAWAAICSGRELYLDRVESKDFLRETFVDADTFA